MMGPIDALKSKIAKQTAEIARLTREIEQLKSDKANLQFDLYKAQAAIKLLAGK